MGKVRSEIWDLVNVRPLNKIKSQHIFFRDDWVKINWENIEPGYYGNFFKYTEEEVTGFGVDYDYDSAMHYSRTGFSINGEDTITPLVRYE